jgi:hypothetical protein
MLDCQTAIEINDVHESVEPFCDDDVVHDLMSVERKTGAGQAFTDAGVNGR